MTMSSTTNTAGICAYHANHGDSVAHSDAMQWANGMIQAKTLDDDEDRFLQWEATYDKFIDCHVCIHEQLIILSGYAAENTPCEQRIVVDKKPGTLRYELRKT
jgi:hypothetical protein